MNTRRLIFWALPVAVSASLACSHENESSAATTPPGITPVTSSVAAAPAPSGATAPPAAPPAEAAQGAQPGEPQQPPARPEARRHAMRGMLDPAKAVLDATEQLSDTDSISLSEAQKSTIRALRAKLEASKKSVETAVQAVRADIANQVRIGSIDRAKVQADESALTNALHYRMTQEADTLDELHATLDRQSRSDVVSAARAERKTGVAEPQGNAEAQGSWESQKNESANDRQKRELGRLTTELDLDAAQQQQVASILASRPAPSHAWQQRHERVDALLNAFQRNTFDAKTALETAWTSPAATVHENVQRRVAFLQKLLPVLHPDQRDKLASMIEREHMDEETPGWR